MNEKLVDITLNLIDAGDFMGSSNLGSHTEVFYFVYGLVLKAYAVGCHDYYMVDRHEDTEPSPAGVDAEAFDTEIDNTPSYCF